MLELSVECGHAHTCMPAQAWESQVLVRTHGCFRGSVLSLKCATAEATLLERLPIFNFLAGLGRVRAFLLLMRRFADCLSEPCACLAQFLSSLLSAPFGKGPCLLVWRRGSGRACLPVLTRSHGWVTELELWAALARLRPTLPDRGT